LSFFRSTAVDFAKNGVSAPRLTSDLRPAKYPHFMENKFKSNYHSETILGQLYDEVKQFEIDLSRDQRQIIDDTSSFPYDMLIVEGSNLYISDARTTKNAYDFELKRVMRQYGIQSEAQLVSGYILKFTSKQYAKQAQTFDLRNEICHAVKIIQDK
jgi:RNA-dependent RNA polymerase